jgi:hypothetical protein
VLLKFVLNYERKANLTKFRKLQDGVQVYELEEPVELVVKTLAPMKWKLVDRETGEEYIGNTPKEGEKHWSKINA